MPWGPYCHRSQNFDLSFSSANVDSGASAARGKTQSISSRTDGHVTYFKKKDGHVTIDFNIVVLHIRCGAKIDIICSSIGFLHILANCNNVPDEIQRA